MGDPAGMFLVQIADLSGSDSGNVLPAVAQRRKGNVEYVQPVVEILAKMVASNGLVGWTICRRQYPHCARNIDRTAQTAHFRFLYHAKQLGLRPDRHLADFIEQQGSVLCLLETPNPALHRARERTFLMTEEFALHKGLGQRGAIDRYKRASASADSGDGSPALPVLSPYRSRRL